MKTLPSTDVVIVGGGWTGLLMAKELGSRTSLSVVVLERGGPRKLADYSAGMDELDYFIRLHMMQDTSRETVTLRHNANERALPIRQLGRFLPGSGIGGTGEHWGALYPRLQPECLRALFEDRRKVRREEIAGRPLDTGLGHYLRRDGALLRARRSSEVGVSGKAGNLKGKKIEGGNIFEGWRSTEYPMPPIKTPLLCSSVPATPQNLSDTIRIRNPAAVTSELYTNPEGVTRPACALCGFCERMGCMIGAKAQPSNMLLPVIQNQKGVSIRTGASVRRIVHDTAQAGGKARGVTYIDASGEEVFQPADLVILASWTLSNTHLLLLSGVGKSLQPRDGQRNAGKKSNASNQLFAARLSSKNH